MVSKRQQLKISKCVKKKIDDKDVLVLRLTGKLPGAKLRELKQQINELTAAFVLDLASKE